MTPCLRRASIAYAEQLGVKRHIGGNIGEMKRLYMCMGCRSNHTMARLRYFIFVRMLKNSTCLNKAGAILMLLKKGELL